VRGEDLAGELDVSVRVVLRREGAKPCEAVIRRRDRRGAAALGIGFLGFGIGGYSRCQGEDEETQTKKAKAYPARPNCALAPVL
jgi:hypothetical protein